MMPEGMKLQHKRSDLFIHKSLCDEIDFCQMAHVVDEGCDKYGTQAIGNQQILQAVWIRVN
jgi:hypothetical protein